MAILVPYGVDTPGDTTQEYIRVQDGGLYIEIAYVGSDGKRGEELLLNIDEAKQISDALIRIARIKEALSGYVES